MRPSSQSYKDLLNELRRQSEIYESADCKREAGLGSIVAVLRFLDANAIGGQSSDARALFGLAKDLHDQISSASARPSFDFVKGTLAALCAVLAARGYAQRKAAVLIADRAKSHRLFGPKQSAITNGQIESWAVDCRGMQDPLRPPSKNVSAQAARYYAEACDRLADAFRSTPSDPFLHDVVRRVDLAIDQLATMLG